jgi:hypothetical protein
MKKIVIIKADYNDADYVTEQSEITGSPELESLVKKVAKCIKEQNKKKVYSGHNWITYDLYDAKRGSPPPIMYMDCLTQDEIEEFNSFVPYGEDGVHTIVSIKILTVSDEEVLL